MPTPYRKEKAWKPCAECGRENFVTAHWGGICTMCRERQYRRKNPKRKIPS